MVCVAETERFAVGCLSVLWFCFALGWFAWFLRCGYVCTCIVTTTCDLFWFLGRGVWVVC